MNSSLPESRIVLSETAGQGEHKCMASLQLDGKHICGSGMFRKGLLLTTGECTWHIKNNLNRSTKKATAVLGNTNLKKGQRIDIIEAVHHPRFLIDDNKYLNNFCDFGIVRVR